MDNEMQILSDSEKRLRYDRGKSSGWSGYFDILERDFYSAVHAAYGGPNIESVNLLPHCFEAEETSTCETPEVLHLVSGHCHLARENLWVQSNSGVPNVGVRGMQAKKNDYHTSDTYKDLEFHVSGKMVALASRVPPKSYYGGIENEDSQDHIFVSQDDPICKEFLQPPFQLGLGFHWEQLLEFSWRDLFGMISLDDKVSELSQSYNERLPSFQARDNLEEVAEAPRVPPKSYYGGIRNEDSQDHIFVYLISQDDPMYTSKGISIATIAVGARIPLGTIIGLGANPEEGSCFVCNMNGTKTGRDYGALDATGEGRRTERASTPRGEAQVHNAQLRPLRCTPCREAL
ncbi:hypothetical protein C3L33_01243, partial [Rhododendron williamsianum]